MGGLTSVARDKAGNAIPNATVTVYLTGTVTLADLFSDPALTLALGNPLTTDNSGAFRFFAAAGTYDLLIQAQGFQDVTISQVVVPVAVADADDTYLRLDATNDPVTAALEIAGIVTATGGNFTGDVDLNGNVLDNVAQINDAGAVSKIRLPALGTIEMDDDVDMNGNGLLDLGAIDDGVSQAFAFPGGEIQALKNLSMQGADINDVTLIDADNGEIDDLTVVTQLDFQSTGDIINGNVITTQQINATIAELEQIQDTSDGIVEFASTLDLGSAFRAINALDPINDQDYATKRYVDDIGQNAEVSGPAFALATGAYATIPLTAISLNNNGWAINGNGVDVPADGIYIIIGRLSFSGPLAGATAAGALLQRNAGTLTNAQYAPITGGALDTNIQVTGIVSATAGDNLTIQGFQDTGGPINVVPQIIAHRVMP